MSVLDLIKKTKVPVGSVGRYVIQRFHVSKSASELNRLQGLFGGHGRYCPPGKYTKLLRMATPESRGALVMSDTQDERNDHREPVMNATGHCLIHGLGLGIVAEACLRKEEVTKVTVIEISPEVIQLVEPYLMKKWGDRLEIIEADCLTWKPPVGAKYGMVWHDIWDEMCLDNNDDYVKLHRRYGSRSGWQGSWGRWFIEREKREAREGYGYGW